MRGFVNNFRKKSTQIFDRSTMLCVDDGFGSWQRLWAPTYAPSSHTSIWCIFHRRRDIFSIVEVMTLSTDFAHLFSFLSILR